MTVPRFQTTVDVTSLVDVTVVDSSGRPITGLGPGDFNVRIDGDERRVLSAEWVPVVENAKALVDDLSIPEGYSSNEIGGGGRLIVIAIDQPDIRFGGSTAMMKTLEGFIDKLLPSDRVGIVGFGPGGPPLTLRQRFESRQADRLAHDRQANSRARRRRTTSGSASRCRSFVASWACSTARSRVNA